jgi:hypothetical protein
VLAQLEAVLQRYPAPAPTSAPVDAHLCSIHAVAMTLQHGKDGATWYSHKTASGWCKGKPQRQ